MTMHNSCSFKKENRRQTDEALCSILSPATESAKRLKPQAVRILVVDKDTDHLGHITAMLDGAGFESVAAKSSAEALDKFMVHPFDIILLELQMPQLDGIALAAILKAAESRISVVLMSDISVRGSLPVVIDGPKEVVDCVINKPFAMDALNGIITQLLSSG